LLRVIESSKDETAIQNLIEQRPQILAALLGRARFLIPRKSLDGVYVPDFLAADHDSAGVRWLLVELETPRSSITLKDRNGLEGARKNRSRPNQGVARMVAEQSRHCLTLEMR
jgi:hypothetical protein